jgi:NADH-quinone oxidoreductase subunit M
MLVGVIYDRRHTKLIDEFGGLATVMPKYALFFAVFMMASVGLPLTIGFVGEFLSLLGFFKVSPLLTAIAGLSIILGAVYMLVLFKRVFYGQLKNEANFNLKDLNKKELSALLPLIVLVVFLGIYPKPILSSVETSVKNTLNIMYVKSIDPKTKETLKKVNNL